MNINEIKEHNLKILLNIILQMLTEDQISHLESILKELEAKEKDAKERYYIG